jgi:cysteine synthase
MSQERFEWLEAIAGEVIATPARESNVKEIFDKCWEMRGRPAKDVVIFNQFDEFGNYLWHYRSPARPCRRCSADPGTRARRYRGGWVVATGSAGTIAAGDYLKQRFPGARSAPAEALQCPTLLQNGFGATASRASATSTSRGSTTSSNTDMVVAIDDEAPHRASCACSTSRPASRLPRAARASGGRWSRKLPLMGISCIGNLLAGDQDRQVLRDGAERRRLTIATDSWRCTRAASTR